VVISYYSRSGNTKEVARAIASGVKEVKGATVRLRSVRATTLRDLRWADAIIFGSPTYYGDMAAEVKQLLDKSVAIHGSLKGKVGAAFTSSGGIASGAETTILSILQAMLVHGMVILGNPDGQHYGVAIVGAPNAKQSKLCRERGKQVAELAARLSGRE
ncbi:MAG TPA: NAD(P)H-dependent oxidoreductase, partial [Thermoproteota archaeon]|nr:NAD(P)H-dependent oxidoreductase [Thermoproteota archaeon]